MRKKKFMKKVLVRKKILRKPHISLHNATLIFFQTSSLFNFSTLWFLPAWSPNKYLFFTEFLHSQTTKNIQVNYAWAFYQINRVNRWHLWFSSPMEWDRIISSSLVVTVHKDEIYAWWKWNMVDLQFIFYFEQLWIFINRCSLVSMSSKITIILIPKTW